MNNVYDNGYRLLGNKKELEKYIYSALPTSDMEELINEILDELKEYYKDDDILCIDYENAMGYTIEKWSKDDKVVE